jgi:hypothetical protein
MITLSASQISIAQECERKVAFRYMSRHPKPPQHPAAALGTRVHAVGEVYLSEGTPPDRDSDEGAIFIKGLPFLPAPGSGGVEGYFKDEIGGIAYQGYVDLLVKSHKLPQWDLPKCWVVHDHKTSSNPATWGKDEKALRTDPQVLIYGRKYLGDERGVGFRWLYLKTKGRLKAYPVDFIMTATEVVEGFDRHVQPTAERLVELYQIKDLDPNSLDPSPQACDNFGGCFYRGVCKLTPQERLKGLMTTKEKNMGLKDTLQKKVQKQQSAAPAINPEPQGKTTTAPVVEFDTGPDPRLVDIFCALYTNARDGDTYASVIKTAREIYDELK